MSSNDKRYNMYFQCRLGSLRSRPTAKWVRHSGTTVIRFFFNGLSDLGGGIADIDVCIHYEGSATPTYDGNCKKSA